MSGLSGAAAAALGMQAPTATPERLAWVDVEDRPEMIGVLDPVDGALLGQVARCDDERLTDLMADKLRAVCDLVDQSGCEADGCEAVIGWALDGEADERTVWRGVTLVQRGRVVLAVCSDDSPTAIYDRLFANPER